MYVNPQDLRQYAAQGSTDAMAATYLSVRTALERGGVTGPDIEIFLQGSYANHTNTRGDSDVDIVVMLTSTFMPDTTRLTPTEVRRHEERRIPGTVMPLTFRERVQKALVAYYGDRVEPKNKCLRVSKTAGYVDADVVPALQHQLFTNYPEYGTPTAIEGISITPLSGPRIVNYPKEHKRRGEAKNTGCYGAYKPTVRQIKRLRRRAVELELLSADVAPGYLLECMASNVPDHLLRLSEVDRVSAALDWLNSHSVDQLREQIWSGDRIHHLFVDDPGRHRADIAKTVLSVLVGML